jgi:hypothetical protein
MPLLGALLLGSLNCAAAQATAPLSGVWDATVHVGAIEVPFEFGIAVKGDQASGWFFNGEQKVVSSSGSFTDHHLVLRFDSYAKKLDAQVGVDGRLEGVYAITTEGSRAPPVAFHAQRANPKADNAQPSIPSIAGQWLIPTQSAKSGENAWRLIVRQSGARVSAAILRVDGDTGALTGRWQDGKLLLSHFDGARPALIEVRPGENGNLQLTLHNSNGTDVPLTAYRQAQASAQGLPQCCGSGQSHQRQESPGAAAIQFPGLKWSDRLRFRPTVSRQGRTGGHLRQLVPELPRRGAVPAVDVPQVSRPGT